MIVSNIYYYLLYILYISYMCLYNIYTHICITNKKTNAFNIGEITLYPLKYPPIFTFTFKVSNVTLTPPPQTFKLWQFDTFDLFIPKMPSSPFFFFRKNNPKTKKKKKKEEKYAGVVGPPHMGWPATPFGLAQGTTWPLGHRRSKVLDDLCLWRSSDLRC
jgi:hypothetical protein